MVSPQGKRKRSRGWRAVFWIALAVFIACIVALGVIIWSYWAPNNRYQELATNSGPSVVDTSPQSGTSSPSQANLSDITVDWDSLRAVNPQIVAWIYMPGTRIDYPVCQASDNQYYLDTDFDGNRNIATRSGTIFLDAGNSSSFSDQNVFMYGHHMNDGSMFACISTQLSDNAEFNAHRKVYVFTPTLNYECTSFSIVLTTGTDALVRLNFDSSNDMASYIRDKEQRSVVTPSEGMPDPSGIQQLFTFSTCDYTQNNGRAVMFTSLTSQAAPDRTHTGAIVDTSGLQGMQGNG